MCVCVTCIGCVVDVTNEESEKQCQDAYTEARGSGGFNKLRQSITRDPLLKPELLALKREESVCRIS